jgi:hypothetical protein
MPENIFVFPVLVGRRLFFRNSCTRAHVSASMIASWVFSNVKLTKSLSKSAEIEQKLPLYWCVFAFQKTDRNVVKSLSLYLDNLIMCIFISFILIEIIGGI